MDSNEKSCVCAVDSQANTAKDLEHGLMYDKKVQLKKCSTHLLKPGGGAAS